MRVRALRPTLALLLALMLGLLLGAAAGAWLWGARVRPPAPRSLEALVPAGVRGVAHLDVTRLRAAPALAQWLGGEARPNDPCEMRLLRQVQRAVVVFEDLSFERLAVAFAGDLSPQELLACARTRRGAGSVQTERYRGLDLVRLAPPSEPGVLPPEAPEIVYMPGGTVVAGDADLVRRMVDHGLSPEPAPARALDELLRRLGGDAPIEVAFRVPARMRNEAATLPALAHVDGVAAGVRFDGGMEVAAVLACNDYDSPRAVSDTLERLRTELAQTLQLPALADPLRAATIERRATDVRVRLTLSAGELDELRGALEGFLSSALPPPEAPPSPPDR
jgi:hypothetical protein